MGSCDWELELDLRTLIPPRGRRRSSPFSYTIGRSGPGLREIGWSIPKREDAEERWCSRSHLHAKLTCFLRRRALCTLVPAARQPLAASLRLVGMRYMRWLRLLLRGLLRYPIHRTPCGDYAHRIFILQFGGSWLSRLGSSGNDPRHVIPFWLLTATTGTRRAPTGHTSVRLKPVSTVQTSRDTGNNGRHVFDISITSSSIGRQESDFWWLTVSFSPVDPCRP